MFEGSCYCGEIRVKSTGEIKSRALCHCLDCRKVSGSAFSSNLMVDSEGFSILQGTPKQYAAKADSGKTITGYFCGNCGTTLWRATESLPGIIILKGGILDPEVLEREKPTVSLYDERRLSWAPDVKQTQK